MKSRQSSFRMSCLVVLLVAVLCGPTSVVAVQNPAQPQTPQHRAFILPPRELSRPIERAREAIANEEFEDAAAYLGEVLATGGQDYLIFIDDNSGTATSIRKEAQRLLGLIPKRHRAGYELRYGIEAKQLLEQALTSADANQLMAVSQRYFHTEAGASATMLLGHRELQDGRPLAAAMAFQRLWDSDEARRKYEPELSILLATARVLTDQEELARDVIADLQKNYDRTRFEFAGQNVVIQSGREPLDWLVGLVGNSPLVSVPGLNEWIMFRGNPERNAVGLAEFPVSYPSWQVPVLRSPLVEKTVNELQRDYVRLDEHSIPAVQALAVGRTLLVKSSNRILGIDLVTGRRNWVFPDDMLFDGPIEEEQNQAGLARKYQNLLWMDSLNGQCSSDGKYLFAIEHEFDYQTNPQVRVVGRDGAATVSNVLRAADIQRDGYYIWEVGGKTGLSEPALAGAFFLGAPLALNGNLYCIAERTGEIQLVCLKAATGSLQWSLQLASSETIGAIGINLERQYTAVTPSYSNGVLVCPTSANSIVAIELASRNFLWGYEYPHRNEARGPRYYASIPPSRHGWLDSSITIAGNRVLCGPVDSNLLICLDLVSGQSLWRAEQLEPTAGEPKEGQDSEPADKNVPDEKELKTRQTNDSRTKGSTDNKVLRGNDRFVERQDANYVGCIDGDLALLVGEDKCRAIDLVLGDVAWELPMAEHGRPSGRGYFAEGYYFLPTTEARLLKIEIRTGKIVEWRKTHTVLGNLICHRGFVISQGVNEVLLLQTEGSLKNELSRLGEQDAAELSPAEMEQMQLLMAQQLILEGDNWKALELVRQSYLRTGYSAIREMMMDLILVCLQDDFTRTRELAEQYEGMLLKHRYQEYARSTIRGLLGQQKNNQALDKIFMMLAQSDQVSDWPADTSSSNGLLGLNTPRISRGRLNRERYEAWVRSTLQQIVLAPDRSERARFLDRIVEFGSEQMDRFKGEELVALARMLNFAGQREAFKLDFADRLFREQQWLASQVFVYPLFQSGPEVSARAEGLYAQLLAGQGRWEDALQLLKSLEARAPSAECYDSMTATELIASLEQRRRAEAPDNERVPSGNIEWAAGPADVRRERTLNRNSYRTYQLIEGSNTGRFTPDYRFEFHQQHSSVQVLSRAGESLAQISIKDPKSSSQYSSSQTAIFHQVDSLLIVALGHMISAIDLYQLERGQEALIWQINTSNDEPSLTNPNANRSSLSSSESNPWKLKQYFFLEYPQRNVGNRTVSSRNQVSVLAPPTHQGIFYISGQELVCADLLSGIAVWRRPLPEASAISPGVALTSNGQNVSWVDIKARRCVTYDGADGTELRDNTWDEKTGEWLLPSGNGALCSVDADDSQVLKRLDFESNQVVWEKEYVKNSRACLVDSRQLGVIEPKSGKLEVFDLLTGETSWQAKLDLGDDNCDSVVIYPRGKQQFLVGVRHRNSGSSISLENENQNYLMVRCVNHGLTSLFDGTLHLVERPASAEQPGAAELMQNVWPAPVRVQNFDLPAEQPADMPLIVLARMVQNRRGRRSFNHVQLAGIDSRTGKEAFLFSDAQYIYGIRMDVDLGSRKLNINTGRQMYQVEFQSEVVRSPQPPAHFDNGRTIDDSLQSVYEAEEKALAKLQEQKQKQLEQRKQELEQKNQNLPANNKKQDAEQKPEKKPGEKDSKADSDDRKPKNDSDK